MNFKYIPSDLQILRLNFMTHEIGFKPTIHIKYTNKDKVN